MRRRALELQGSAACLAVAHNKDADCTPPGGCIIRLPEFEWMECHGALGRARNIPGHSPPFRSMCPLALRLLSCEHFQKSPAEKARDEVQLTAVQNPQRARNAKRIQLPRGTTTFRDVYTLLARVPIRPQSSSRGGRPSARSDRSIHRRARAASATD